MHVLMLKRKIMKLRHVLLLLGLFPFLLNAQLLTDFEDETAGLLSIEADAYVPNLFTQNPGIYDNPDLTGINTSQKCLGAINIPDATWFKNFAQLKLQTPVTINAANRMLTFLVYRSIQPKEFRIGFNGYEESNEVYLSKTLEDGKWERVVIDLGEKHLNETLESIWIIFSTNWYNPRSGWAEAAYYYDDFRLSTATLPTFEVLIKADDRFQTIDDFGASDAWNCDPIGNHWGEAEKEYIAEKLFSQELDASGNPLGIGLSTWRFNLGAGTAEQGNASGITDMTRRTECVLNTDGSYNWNKQTGQQYFLKKALEYGCENMVLFSNSPPVFMTKNGKGFANPGEQNSNLQSDKYDDFAEFLATAAAHFNNEGYNVTHISPVNEPQYNWTEGQEGSPWQNSDITKLTKALNSALEAKSLNTKIALAEAGSWGKLYENSGRASNQIYAFFNPTSSNYVGNLDRVDKLISGHSYWTFNTNSTLRNVRKTVGDMAKEYGLKTYQTEWSMLDAPPEPETGFPESYDAASYMDIALFMGKLIHNDLVLANVSSWSYWTSVANEVYGQKNRFMLLRYTPSNGAGGYDPYGSILNGGKVEDTPNLWVLGNYSRFIRPGYQRIRIDGAAEMNYLLGSAYLSPDSSKIVAVYVNTQNQYRKIQPRFDFDWGSPVSIKGYYTSNSAKLKRITYIKEDGVNNIVILNPRSVTTLVYDIEKSASALSEHLKNPQLFVYPNPVKRGQVINVLLPEEIKGDQALQLKVFSPEGKEINAQIIKKTEGNNMEITLPGTLKNGVYLMRMEANVTHLFQQLIVK